MKSIICFITMIITLFCLNGCGLEETKTRGLIISATEYPEGYYRRATGVYAGTDRPSPRKKYRFFKAHTKYKVSIGGQTYDYCTCMNVNGSFKEGDSVSVTITESRVFNNLTIHRID